MRAAAVGGLWVIERTMSCPTEYRRLNHRFERNPCNYLAFLGFAQPCAAQADHSDSPRRARFHAVAYWIRECRVCSRVSLLRKRRAVQPAARAASVLAALSSMKRMSPGQAPN